MAKKILPSRVLRAVRQLRHVESPKPQEASTAYELFEGPHHRGELDGWRQHAVAERQHATFLPLLQAMRDGRPRADFTALAEAVRRTEVRDALILEVGCGSGWNAEVIELLVGTKNRYIGIDYSYAMTALGRRHYPGQTFIAGDATALPFGTASCDIVVSGTSLMHIEHYAVAVSESRRVSRRWCIFHGVPVMVHRDTTLLRKRAYGERTLEVIFNEATFLRLLTGAGLRVGHVLDAFPYDLAWLLGEPTMSKTYVCEVAP